MMWLRDGTEALIGLAAFSEIDTPFESVEGLTDARPVTSTMNLDGATKRPNSIDYTMHPV